MESLHNDGTLTKTPKLLCSKACLFLAPISVFLSLEGLKTMVLALKATPVSVT